MNNYLFIFVVFKGDGFVGHLSEDFTSIVGTFSLTNVNSLSEAKLTRYLKSTPLCSWVPLVGANRELVASVSPKSGQIVAFEFKQQGEVVIQTLKPADGGRVEGLDTFDGDTFYWTDNGTLVKLNTIVETSQSSDREIYNLFSKAALTKEIAVVGKGKEKETKQSSAESSKLVFPITFFESCTCITPEVTISSPDFTYNSDAAKKKLSTPNEFIASSNNDSLTLTISHSSTTRCIAGLRVFVGTNNTATIPGELKFLGRTIKTK